MTYKDLENKINQNKIAIRYNIVVEGAAIKPEEYPEVKEIIKTRNIAREKSGRIEFNGQIVNKIIMIFCDSPYISQFNYSDTINELVEIFYNYKNETLDMIGDDELIEIMKEYFDGYCQGSLELLEGKVLYIIADNIRNGVKDYTDINNEKEK